jgi:hypothetical protein
VTNKIQLIGNDGSDPDGWIAQQYGPMRYPKKDVDRRGIMVLRATPKSAAETQKAIESRWGWSCHDWPNKVTHWEGLARDLYLIVRRLDLDRNPNTADVDLIGVYECGPWLERLMDRFTDGSVIYDLMTPHQDEVLTAKPRDYLIEILAKAYKVVLIHESEQHHPLLDLFYAAGVVQVRAKGAP